MNMRATFRKHIIIFALLAIIVLAFFLRFYKLDQIPKGLYQDETAIGYNAYSILQTGKDEYGKVFPLYFKSFGDYKLPLYIYLDVIPVKIFGLNEFSARLPSAFFGLLTIIVSYFLIKELSGKKSLALLSALLLAINPWHLFYSRAAFEVSVALFLFCLGTLLLYLALEKSRRGMFWLGTVFFILAVYTYNLTRLLSPLLYLLILFFYRKKVSNIKRSETISTVVILFILLLPFGLTFFDKAGAGSVKGTFLFTSNAVLAPLLEFRSYLVGLPELFSKIFFNNILLLFWQYLQNIISYLSVTFLFLTGDSHGNHGISNVGQFYLFEIILIPLGIFEAIRSKLRYGYLLLGWSSLVILVASLTREAPQATRSFFLVLPLEIFSGLGVLVVVEWLKTIKDRRVSKILAVCFFAFMSYNIIYFLSSYFVRFPVSYAKSWRSPDKEVVNLIKQKSSDYDEVVVDQSAGLIYTSLLFYQKFSPAQFQNTVQRGPDDKEGFSQVNSFGKFFYQKIDWSKDLKRPPKRLFVTMPGNLPAGKSALATFYYPEKPVVLSIKEQIIQYPEAQTAYVVYESD